ncbi:unnamed protein product [Rhizoctonia solani]|uniref:Uncharacterized protein n=1 Tax=Rhizoctonia solani TaxID=456999 RepID=A0A8H3E7D8_9AGAM|nr:unnamed protein product [Rhizoctonia solani]
MADNHEDPPWLRPAPILVVSRETDEEKNPQISILSRSKTKSPPSTTAPNSDMSLLSPPVASSSGPSSSKIVDEDQYVGWIPQQNVQHVALSPPLSPLDLAMYPGVRAPPAADPIQARRAVAGLKPLRILSSRRPGGPASAGSNRQSSEAMGSNAFSGFMGFFSAAKRASAVVASGPPSASSRASIQSASVTHTPIPVSPLPSPETPPLVPTPSLAPELLNQMEPELKAHLDALATQAAAGPSSSSSRPVSASRPPPSVPIEEEEEMELEIRDLSTGEIIKIRDLNALPSNNGVNPTSPTVSTKEQNARVKTPHSSTFIEPYRIPLPHSPSNI